MLSPIQASIWISAIANLLVFSKSQAYLNSSVRDIQNLSVHDAQAALEAASNIDTDLESATQPIEEEEKELDGLIKYAGVFGGSGVDYLEVLPEQGDVPAVPPPPHIRVKRFMK